ncbi:MAG: hypothetical protein INQ03_00595 [Candidatus Heimdallarchaeota archaeon]|nr:hypothetical protein [Candidatus Heimdallarchaeota archaeon]
MRDLSSIVDSKGYRFFIIWHILATIIWLIIGFAESDFSMFLSLFIWTVIAIVAYIFEPKLYIVSAFILSAVEEFVVYQFGGGLQGKAISLLHDYVNALPVFLGLIIGYYLVLRKYRINEFMLYFMAGLHGSFIELLFQGILFDPILLFLIGGPNFFIYGSIFDIPKKPAGDKEFGILGYILSWFFVLFFMLIGAIIADNLNSALGF